MNTDSPYEVARAAISGTPRQVLFRAGALEALRLIQHPIHIAGWLYFLVLAWSTVPQDTHCRPGPLCFYVVSEQAPGMLPRFVVMTTSVPTFAAASLLATRPRRTGTAEWLASLPSGTETRWTISLIAATGPFALSALATGMCRLLMQVNYLDLSARYPLDFEYAMAPVAELGFGLLAVLVARSLPYPLAPVVVMACLIQAINIMSSLQYRHRWVGWLIPYPDVTSPGFAHGSLPWHLSYLVAIDLFIAVAVFLFGRYRRYAATVATPILALAALSAVQQLR